MNFRDLTIAFFALVVAGCSSHRSTGIQPQAFNSPEEAVSALVSAVEKNNRAEVRRIFGSEGEYLSSGDEVEDAMRRRKFVRLYRQKHTLEENKNEGTVTLVVGEREWPLPIPLVKQGAGWSFDADAGKEEILNRRIGENELRAIALAEAFVDAEEKYYNLDPDNDGVRQFAQNIVSTPGKHDGLYWEGGKTPSPFGPLVSQAESEGYDIDKMRGRPYHGYYYKILTGQGENAADGPADYISSDGRMTEGFALLAFPAKWGETGVMSFQVNYDGKIFQKNLGEDTPDLASKIVEFNPDPSWQTVKK